MLDNTGLSLLLETHGEASPAEIVDRILAELRDYEVNDDVSLVVIKQTAESPSRRAAPGGEAGASASADEAPAARALAN